MQLFFICLIIYCSSATIFQQEEIIQYVNKVQLSWKAGHNHYFDGKTLEDIQKLMGAL